MLLTLFGGGVGILLVLGFVVRVFLLVLFVCLFCFLIIGMALTSAHL